MEIPQFSGDEDKDEINPMEWLRMENKIIITPSREMNFFW
jgi:hypothetical protein